MPSEHRLHPSSVIFQLGGQLKNLLIPGIVALLAARASSESTWEIWAMLLLIPYTAAAIMRALSVRYRFEASELVIRTGFIFRRERRIPYDRIHNIDAIQNVAHRLLNVMEVRLETAGGTGTEADLKVLSVDAFKEMRQRVYAGRGAAIAESAAAPAAPAAVATPLLQLPAREIALLGLLEGRGFVVLSAAFGALWELGLVDRIGQVFGADAAGRGVFRQFVRALVGQGAAPTQQVALMLAAFVAFLLAMRLLSVGVALLRFYGFVLARTREELRSEFGLLTRVTATIPMRRIQMLTVHRGPLHRLFRRAAVRVDTAGGHGEEKIVQAQRRWIVPIAREPALPELIRAVLPVADTAVLQWQTVHPRAFRRAVWRSLFVMTLVSLGLVALLHWWTIAAWMLLSVWTATATRRYVDSLRWAITDDTIAFRSGWLWRYFSIAPLAKVQAVSLHESPFDRRHGMATLLVDTAGGHDAPHRVRIPFLPRDAASALRDRLVASAANTAFRW